MRRSASAWRPIGMGSRRERKSGRGRSLGGLGSRLLGRRKPLPHLLAYAGTGQRTFPIRGAATTRPPFDVVFDAGALAAVDDGQHKRALRAGPAVVAGGVAGARRGTCEHRPVFPEPRESVKIFPHRAKRAIEKTALLGPRLLPRDSRYPQSSGAPGCGYLAQPYSCSREFAVDLGAAIGSGGASTKGNPAGDGDEATRCRARLLHACRPRRRGSRSLDRSAGDADLSDDLVCLQRRRPRGRALQSRGFRQHLHAHRRPHPGRAGAAHRRARRRNGGSGGRLRSCGAGSRLPYAAAARR